MKFRGRIATCKYIEKHMSIPALETQTYQTALFADKYERAEAILGGAESAWQNGDRELDGIDVERNIVVVGTVHRVKICFLFFGSD